MLAAAAIAAAALPAPAAAAARCVTVGVYEDAPGRDLDPLQAAVGEIGALQVYLSADERLSPALVRRANTEGLRLVIAWLPVEAARVRGMSPVQAIARGRLDARLARLVRSLRPLRVPPVLRPLPEPNAPWHPWSRGVRGSNAAGYRAAFRRVARVVRATPGGARVRLLWSPSARSYPDVAANALEAFFPGRAATDLVGASAVNVGAVGGHVWESPGALLAEGLAEAARLDPTAGVWVAETGTVEGPEKAAWIGELAALRARVPRLAGVLWYDVRDRVGDFRIRSSAASIAAFRQLNRGRCS